MKTIGSALRRFAARVFGFGPLTAVGKWLTDHWREALLVCASTVLTYVIMEIGYRAYQYRTLSDRLSAEVAAQPSTGPAAQDQFMYDAHTGYRYTPDFEGRRGPPWYSHWRTNSHGHVSRFDYPQRKPPREYRIAVVGDSFTANITNTVRWTELVEQQLNGTPRWRAAVDDRFTRVINFGVDGMGMVQFGAMVRHHVMEFQPDLIIVNFIADDILRRLRYLNRPTGLADRNVNIRAYVEENFLRQINWLRVYPELFAATAGYYFGMQTQLPLDHRLHLAHDPAFKFASRTEAIQASAAAAKEMLAASPGILFLHVPMFQELAGWAIPEWQGLAQQFARAVPELSVIAMQPRMEALLAGKRPKDRADLAGLNPRQIWALSEERRPELYRWFFAGDFHPTDYGTTVYADEVARVLIERSMDHRGSEVIAGDRSPHHRSATGAP
ncbi:MAG: SGNH/GDSL hydrolase family protein [Xanthobacteraceae bacterium]